MTFMWPHLLWLMALLPLLIALYVWLLSRRKKASLRYASLSLVKDAMGKGQRIRRHIPPLLFLLSLGAMIASMARPMAVVTLPSQHDLVVLAMDVSRSMLAEDVKPTRIVAAQQAARAFVNDQPRDTRIAVVSFAATAALVQPSTNVREDVIAAIDRFQLQRGTAIGSGILVSLATIFPDANIDLSSTGSDAIPNNRNGTSLDQAASGPKDGAAAFKPVPPGSYGSAAIILLTDGQTTTGIDPIDAAKIAADRGVRIFTVGIGTVDGEVLHTEGWSMHVRLDEDTLKKIADITRGEYYYAGTALDLKKVYQTLNAKLVFETKETEITALFSAVAAALALISGLLSVLWFNRIL
jgi:Ca-activated chloride channel family protein